MILAHLLVTSVLWPVWSSAQAFPAQAAPLTCTHSSASPTDPPPWTFAWEGMDLGPGDGAPYLEVTTRVDRTVELSFPEPDGRQITCRRVVNEETLREFRNAITAAKVCALTSVDYGPTKRRIYVSVEFGPQLRCAHTYEWTAWQRSAAGRKVKAALEWLTRATCASQCPPRGGHFREMLWPGLQETP
jgi:hypothetical protein